MTETTRDGYAAIALSAGDLTATFVPRLGMIGASLTHENDELLGQRKGLAAYEATGSTMGIPLLHPWANRLSRLTYEAGGTRVAIDPDHPRIRLDPNGLPIHGLLNASPHWHVTSAQDDTLIATLDFGAHPELLEAFPFPHEITITATLRYDTLAIVTAIRAPDPVPISFGYHPYLTLPNLPREEWHVELPVRYRLPTDARGIPTGEQEPADEPSAALGTRDYDDGYKGTSGPFVLQGGGRRIELSLDSGYPYSQVYAPRDQPLICFEPMTAPTNALVSHAAQLADRHEAAFHISVKRD